MKKPNVMFISVLAILVISLSVVIARNDENQGVTGILSQIKEVLLSILEKLNIIAEKETTVVVEPNITVEPPQVTVEGGNEMPKRGRIVAYDNNRGSYATYLALPLGICNITVNGNGKYHYQGQLRIPLYISEAKEINDYRNEQSCSRDGYLECTKTINLDEEYSMLRIKPCTGDGCLTPDWLDITYSCV